MENASFNNKTKKLGFRGSRGRVLSRQPGRLGFESCQFFEFFSAKPTCGNRKKGIKYAQSMGNRSGNAKMR